MPVVNLSRGFRLPERELGLSNQPLLVHTARRPVALVIDAVTEIATLTDQDTIAGEKILADLEYPSGVVKRVHRLRLIHDFDRVFFP
jgi:purine-binding chemotaxis protein CheW